MSTDELRAEVTRLRADVADAQRELTRASAVLTLLEAHRDRVARGTDAGDGSVAVKAFRRYLRGDDRPDSLSYLTGGYVDGGRTSALDAARSPTTSAVDGFVRDLGTHVGGGAVDAATLTRDFESLVTDGTADDLGALVALFEHAVAAARGFRDDREAKLNDGDRRGESDTSGDPGAIQSFLDGLDDELALLPDEPVALLPVRLETRFVWPNDDRSPRLQTGRGGRLPDFNRTDPPREELRVRVYPDQVHVDSHEPELTVQEEQWGRNFWAQVWFACQPPTTESYRTEDGTQGTRTVHEYAREKVPDDLEPMLDDLEADWKERFSTDEQGLYEDVKERAWNQVVERFGRERGAYVVHATAPTTGARAMLSGYADGAPFADGTPTLEFPEVDLRPGSWARQPMARLLPDRWVAVGHWRHKDDDEGDTRTVRVTGDAIRHPLPVGPSPERVGSEELSETPGDAPPGMEWMTDWAEAKEAGMGLTVTAADLGGTDPGDVVFEEFVVVGVRASATGAEATDDLESLFAAHHYTDGLEFLDRGTPTNNSKGEDAGYRRTDDPAESVADEAGPPLTTFGDFTDGDLLSRALGIASPGDGTDHVFAHVAGADGRSAADARHMNSLLWPGTVGYYLRNLLVDNRWTDRQSIWEDYAGLDGGAAKSFPTDPATELGETLKQVDAWRRHFVRYVRAGGPFPPLRVGRQPYGVLPAATVPADDGASDGPFGAIATDDVAERVRERADRQPVTDTIGTPQGEYRLDTSAVQPTGESPADGTTTPDVDATSGTAGAGTGADASGTPDRSGSLGEVSRSGYSVAVSETETQVDRDLYGSSFDPVVPTRSSTPALSKGGSGGFSLPDGGVDTRTRHRAFRTDDEFPARLQSWLGAFDDAWAASTGNVDRVGGGPERSDLVDRILGREANADDFVRERLFGYDALEAKFDVSEADVRDTLGTVDAIRDMLVANDLQGLDPRLAWMLPQFSILGGEVGDRPVSVVTDGHEPAYLEYLYTEPVRFLRKMGWPVGLDHVTVDRERLKGAMDWGSEIDSLSDAQLFLHVVLTNPEHGKLVDLVWGSAQGTLNLGRSAGEHRPTYENKLLNLMQTGGASLQNTLFKQVTRFSTLQAYVGGRMRLGLKWDTLDLESASQFLTPDTNEDAPSADEVADYEEEHGEGNVRIPDYTQQPVPDPAVHGEDTKTVWDWLEEDVPDEYRLDGTDTSYAELLWKTSAPVPAFDTPTVDPRMREVFDAIDYLSDRDAGDVGRLFTETLDLASHRLDAWWTSLATRRLFEHRETQEADFYDGAEYAFVGDHFVRGEDTEAEPDLGGDDGTTLAGAGLADDFSVTGRTKFGHLENQQLYAKKYGPTAVRSDRSGASETGAERAAGTGSERAARERGGQRTAETAGGDEAAGSPVTYVGAYGYVEDLHSDTLADELDTATSASGGAESEYIHAPSPQHATTAAILRSGRSNHADGDDAFEAGDLANLLDIDLSPGRVRAARQVLDGIRQGQMLGDLLGYRFERRLLERSRAFNEAHDDENRSIVLPKYKFALRRAFPGTEGQLDHGAGEDGDDELDVGTHGAASDVLDGYLLFTTWQERESDAAFFADVAYDGSDAATLADAMTADEREAMVGLLGELEAIVDAVTDLLVAENVHQLGKGNFDRAGGQIDDLVKGKAVADPEVTQTPRDDVGVTHRLGVAFGDPATASTAPEWTYDSAVVDPGTLPGTGSGSPMANDGDVPLTLQTRAGAEPNLDAWLGDLLPSPDRVSCRASLTWDEAREFASGTFTTPTSEGVVSVEGLGFQPDLVVLGLAHGVPEGGTEGAATHYGFTNGVALRDPAGDPEQVSTSVGTALGGQDAGGVVDESHALTAHLHAADGNHGRLRGSVRFLADGFDVAFDTVRARGPAADGLVVTYRAYSFANLSNVEVGTFTTGTGTGSDSVPLDVTADHALLFGTTVATEAGTDVTTTGAAGFSQGAAVAGQGGVHQHAVGSSVDPDTGAHASGVRDDRALHLPFASGGAVAGTTSLQVTGLGDSLDVTYRSTHAGAAGDAARVVTYVAIGSDEDAPTPELGVVDGTRSAGDTDVVRTGFRPGVVELVALPGVSSRNADASTAVGGLAQGAATEVGAQQVVHHAVRADDAGGFVGVGGETGGDGVALPALAADGSVGGSDVVRVTSLSDEGFTLTFPEVAGDAVVAWRAWPEAPESVTHVAETGVTLDDLELSPLDALALSQQNRKAGASQLERRMRYHLVRNPPAHEPPVPADATADLEFGATAPSAGGSDPLSIGAFLEVVGGLRELVQGSRPMDAGDLGHPDEEAGTGHTDHTVTELRERADIAQARLAAAGDVLDNRVRLLDPEGEGETALTDQVATLHDGVRAFTREVPFEGLAKAASDVGDALAADADAFVTDLEAVQEHFPAGSTDRATRSFDVSVAPAPGQTVTVETGTANATLDVELWSTSAAEWFEHSTQVTSNADGECTVTVDFSDVRVGTGFVVVLRTGGTVAEVVRGCVLVPEGATEVDADVDQYVSGEIDANAAETVTVSVTAVGASSPLATAQVETDPVGSFVAGFDFSGQDPWTLFAVEATDGGTTVHEGWAYVRPSPGQAVAESDVLSAALWVDDRADAFLPSGDGPTATLDRAVTEGTDWDAVRTELAVHRDLNGKTGGGEAGIPAASDVDAVANLVVEDGEAALESLDLEAVDAAVAGVTGVVDEFGLADLFDVTGRPDRAGGTGFWPVTAAVEDERAQARLANLLDHPDRVFASGTPGFGFAPELEAVLGRESVGVYPREDEDVERLARYLRALADFLPAVVDDPAMTTALTDPAGFARAFRALVYHPEALPTGAGRSTFLDDFRTFVRERVLGGILGVDEALAEAEVDDPYYNRDRDLLDGPVVDDQRAGTDLPADELADLRDERAARERERAERKRELRRELGDEALVWDLGLDIDEPTDTPDGTSVTDCRYLLEGFRRAFLPAYLEALDGSGSGSGLPTPAQSRSEFTATLTGRLSTLATVVAEQDANLDAARRAGAFDEAFRRGVLETLRRALLRVSYFGVYGATPRSADGGSPADEERLVAQARTVHDEVLSRYRESAAGAPGPGEETTVDEQVARLHALFGEDFRVLPPFEPVNGAELTATFGRSGALQDGDPMAAETWLQRVARVREESATFRRALSYAETVTGARHRDLRVGQLPHRQAERWVGLDGHDPEPGRLSLVMQEAAGFDGDYATDRVTGLFVDELVENVPGETETTGVALKYDDPDATAPHAILLALPDEEEGWSTDHLTEVVTDTMRLARYRMVDLEDLDDFGTLLPMLAFPKNDRVEPDAPSVDVDRIQRYHQVAPDWWTVQQRKNAMVQVEMELLPTVYTDLETGGED